MPSKIPAPYGDLKFPSPPTDRPYIFINMVTTIDGKTVSGTRKEGVMDLGSETDHSTMRNIQAHADAVMIGAQTLRITKGLWYPKRLVRVVVTRSGRVNRKSRFFTDAPEMAVVACPKGVRPSVPKGVQIFSKGTGLDLKALLKFLRTEKGVRYLLVEGGSELNASILSRDLVDELFLTFAPKIKLGRDNPTYAGGEPLPRSKIQTYKLLEENRIGDELFLRYRRDRR